MELDQQVMINWGGETLHARFDRTLHWPRENVLIFTDPHFGKASAFRSAGIPLPGGTTDSDLSRLCKALEDTRPQRVVILGDFFHHKTGQSQDVLEKIQICRQQFLATRFDLVLGNHDLKSAPLPASWQIHVHPHDLIIPPFHFIHKPGDIKRVSDTHRQYYSMAGHVHPGIRLRRKVGFGRTLPCFWFGERTALLPAFSLFTGTYQIKPRPQDHVIAVGNDSVFVPPAVA